MLKPSLVLSLSLVAGAAMAQSLPALPDVSALSGLTSVLSGLGLASLPTTGLPAAPDASALTGLTSALTGTGLPAGVPSLPTDASAPALPGLGALALTPGALPLGVTATQPGLDGSGPAYVLGLGENPAADPIIGNILPPIVTPLLGSPSGTGPLAVGVIDGNGVANAAPDGLASVAAISGSNNANGGLIGLGVINDNNTGSGSLLGIAALSGQNAGTSSSGLGVGILNQGSPLSITGGGQNVSVATLQQQASALPGFDMNGIAINSPNATSSNPVANVSVLSNGGGSGGLLGAGVLSSNAANNAQVAGLGLISGDNTANGSPVSANIIGGNNTGNGSAIGAGIINGNNAGNGGVIGAGVINGAGSGNGGTLGAGVLNGANSGNGGVIGAGVLNGAGSGQGGTLGVGVINGAGNGNTTVSVAGVNLGNDKQCVIVTKDANGKVTRIDKVTCKPGVASVSASR